MAERWVQHAIMDLPMLEDVGPETARTVLGMTVTMLFEAAERQVTELGGTFLQNAWRLRVARLAPNPVYATPAQLMLMVDGWVEGVQPDHYDYEEVRG